MSCRLEREDMEEDKRFKRLLIMAIALSLPFVVVQLGLALVVTPLFVRMYTEADIAVQGLPRLMFSLGPLLALLLLVVDALLFGLMYLLARDHGVWLLFVPVAIFAIIAGAWVPLLYVPLFESMTPVQ
jgi:hypothetical protein